MMNTDNNLRKILAQAYTFFIEFLKQITTIRQERNHLIKRTINAAEQKKRDALKEKIKSL